MSTFLQCDPLVLRHHENFPRRLCLWLHSIGFLECVHASARYDLFVLIAQPRDLQESIDTVTRQAVQLEAAGPVLGVHAAQGQAHPEAQIRGPAGERGERALVGRRLEVRAAELGLIFDGELLHGGGHAGDAVQVPEALLAEGAFAECPEVGELVAGDAAAAVRDADGGVLGGLGDGDLDGRGGFVRAAVGLVTLDDGLDRVA